MKVIKRDGRSENVSFDKILTRISKLSHGLSIDPCEIAKNICSSIFDGVTTEELDEFTANYCGSNISLHPDYDTIASRILVSNLHKTTCDEYENVAKQLYDNGLVTQHFYSIVLDNKTQINEILNYSNDYLFDYFGFKTLERNYLLRINGKIVERPQHMWMRVAIGIHSNMESICDTYTKLSAKCFTHATPTLFNASTLRPQLSSCFLSSLVDDSINGIFESLKECAEISKHSGGIGIHIHQLRGKNSKIKGTNGTSDGIIPFLRVFNATAKAVNQGSKRNGSIAVYIEPWHCDIEAFLDIKKNHGNEDERCRDLFPALWIPDLFMERVKQNGVWSLMCPNESPGLSDVYGDEFKTLYESYENKGIYRAQVKAQMLWFKILESQIETGTPYMLYKDAVNKKSNQSHLGVIKSSNLCCEITEYSSPKETAVCNLASICLPSYIEDNGFNFKKLHHVVKTIVGNLNKIIDINYYPLEKAKKSNLLHRPIGIGIQGLADIFILLKLPFESEEAKKLNKDIFETMYHAALEKSMELSFVNRTETDSTFGAHSSFKGSPLSKGIFQFDLWGYNPGNGRYNWDLLKEMVKTYGVRNSLLIAPMPTASTAQIMGNNESFEPYTSNIFKRKTISGEFIVVNKHLMRDLISLGLWNKQMRDDIISNGGSIQSIETIPQSVREIYKTIWEIKQKTLIDMAADRAVFICQSQSLNLYMEDPTFKKLSSMHFYAWERGLKTGLYYLRTRPKAQAQKFTIEPKINVSSKNNKKVECTDEICTMCSS